MESEPEPAAPEAVVQPPSFIKPISNIVVDEGSPTCFEAVFAGEPEPEITWLRNGEPIRTTRDFKVSQIVNFHTCSLYNSDQHASLHDLFLTSSPDFCHALQLCPLSKLDHTVVSVDISSDLSSGHESPIHKTSLLSMY